MKYDKQTVIYTVIQVISILIIIGLMVLLVHSATAQSEGLNLPYDHTTKQGLAQKEVEVINYGESFMHLLSYIPNEARYYMQDTSDITNPPSYTKCWFNNMKTIRSNEHHSLYELTFFTNKRETIVVHVVYNKEPKVLGFISLGKEKSFAERRKEHE